MCVESESPMSGGPKHWGVTYCGSWNSWQGTCLIRHIKIRNSSSSLFEQILPLGIHSSALQLAQLDFSPENSCLVPAGDVGHCFGFT